MKHGGRTTNAPLPAITLVFAMASVLVLVAMGTCWADSAADLQQAQQMATQNADTKEGIRWQGLVADYYWTAGMATEAVAATNRQVEMARAQGELETVQTIDYSLAAHYRSLKQYDQATPVYQALVAEFPDAKGALGWQKQLCDCLSEAGKTTDAIVALKKLVDMAKAAENLDCVKETQNQLAADYRTLKQPEQAAQVYQDMATEFTGAKDGLTAQKHACDCWAEAGKTSEAVDAMKKLVDMAKAQKDMDCLKETQTGLVAAYIGLKQPDSVLSVYQDMVTEFPDAKEALRWQAGIADCYEQMGKSAETLDAKKKLVDMAKAQGDVECLKSATRQLAALYQTRSDHATAITLYQELVNEFPDDPAKLEWLTQTAACYRSKGDYQNAETTARAAIATGPDVDGIEGAYHELAMGLDAQGKHAEALECLDKVYASHPERRPQALLWKAEILTSSAHDYAGAVSALKEVLDAQPWGTSLDSEARAFMVEVLATSGRTDEAVRTVEGMDQRPSPERLDRIAQIYLRGGRHSEAANTYKDLLSMQGVPQVLQAKAKYYLGVCSESIGDHPAAEAYMQAVASGYPDTGWAVSARAKLASW